MKKKTIVRNHCPLVGARDCGGAPASLESLQVDLFSETG